MVTFEQAVTRMGIAQQVRKDEDHFLEVSENLFKHITQGDPAKFIFYKGVKVYRKGTKAEIDEKDSGVAGI